MLWVRGFFEWLYPSIIAIILKQLKFLSLCWQRSMEDFWSFRIVPKCSQTHYTCIFKHYILFYCVWTCHMKLDKVCTYSRFKVWETVLHSKSTAGMTRPYCIYVLVRNIQYRHVKRQSDKYNSPLCSILWLTVGVSKVTKMGHEAQLHSVFALHSGA